MTIPSHSPVITCLLKLQLIAVVAVLLAGSGPEGPAPRR
jgi:hypothetical protein